MEANDESKELVLIASNLIYEQWSNKATPLTNLMRKQTVYPWNENNFIKQIISLITRLIVIFQDRESNRKIVQKIQPRLNKNAIHCIFLRNKNSFSESNFNVGHWIVSTEMIASLGGIESELICVLCCNVETEEMGIIGVGAHKFHELNASLCITFFGWIIQFYDFNEEKKKHFSTVKWCETANVKKKKFFFISISTKTITIKIN